MVVIICLAKLLYIVVNELFFIILNIKLSNHYERSQKNIEKPIIEK